MHRGTWLRIAGWTFWLGLRSRFLLTWNLLVLVLALSLNDIVFFVFDRKSAIVGDLFLSTLALSAGVNSIAFHWLFTLRQKRAGTWRTFLAGPATGWAISGGLGVALVGLQQLHGLVLTLVFDGAMAWRGLELPAEFWPSYWVLATTFVGLGFFHLAVSVTFQESWAVLLMVGGYVLGHLSEQLYRSALPGLRVPLHLLYCVVPDLEPAGYLLGGATRIPDLLVPQIMALTLVQALFFWTVAGLGIPGAANRPQA